jgi:ribosome-associated protein
LTFKARGDLSPSEIKELIEKSLDADKALGITTIHLDDQTGLADFMIIASGTSSRHVSALAENLKDRLSSRGVKGVTIEGQTQADWVVIDAGDVIVHLFRPEVREFYNIERMWGAFQPFDVISDQVSA